MDEIEVKSVIKFFHSIIHNIIFLGIIDINILKIYFNKTNPNKINDHLKTSLFIIFLNFFNQILLYYNKDFFYKKKKVFWIDVIITFFIILQIILGFYIRKKIKKKKHFTNFYFKKKVHKYNTLAIIVLSKSKMFFIWNYYLIILDMKKKIENKIIYIYIYIWIILYLFLYVYFKTKKKLAKYRMAKKNSIIYWDMQNSINNMEYSLNNSNSESSLLSFLLEDDEEPKYNFNDYKNFFIFENKFYEISKLDHPGGNFIFKKILQKDCTKYIYGKSSFIFLHKNKFIFLKHIHGFRCFNFLKKICLGPLKIENLFIKLPFSKNSINLHDNKSLRMNKDLKTAFQKFETEQQIYIYQYKIHKYFKFSKNFYFYLIKKFSDNMYTGIIDLNFFWINIIGKYYILFFENKNKYFINSLISYNPNYLKSRKLFLKQISLEIYNYNNNLKTKIIKKIENVKDYEKDIFLSYYNSTLSFSEIKDFPNNFILKGPLGLGLGIKSLSTRSYLIIIHNEGIINFLDFFEILIQKYILKIYGDIINEKDINFVFGKEYLLEFENGIKIFFYWFLDDDFFKLGKSFGLYQLEFLLFLQSKLKDKSEIIFKDCFIHNKYLTSKYKFLKKIEENSYEFLRNYINKNNFGKIILSGKEIFFKTFIKKINLKYEYLENIYFLN